MTQQHVSLSSADSCEAMHNTWNLYSSHHFRVACLSHSSRYSDSSVYV